MNVEVERGIQTQGPVVVIPLSLVGRAVTADSKHKPRTVPEDGVELLATRGHSHVLLSNSATFGAARDSERMALGVLEVTSRAYIFHPDYAAVGIGPGRYVIRHQRELATR